MLECDLETLLLSVQTLGLALQARDIKKSKSIYGLSFDYVVLSAAQSGCSLIFTVLYRHLSVVAEQYSRRFPIHPHIPISTTVMYIEVLNLLFAAIISLQCWKYRQTRHRFQCVSRMLAGCTMISALVVLWILLNVDLKDGTRIGGHGFYLIDFVDFFWILANGAAIFKWSPQFFTNFIGVHFCWTVRYAILTDMSSSGIVLLIRLIRDSHKFYEFPVNTPGSLTLMLQIILPAVLLYQKKLYNGTAKRLPPMSAIKDDERHV